MSSWVRLIMSSARSGSHWEKIIHPPNSGTVWVIWIEGIRPIRTTDDRTNLRGPAGLPPRPASSVLGGHDRICGNGTSAVIHSGSQSINHQKPPPRHDSFMRMLGRDLVVMGLREESRLKPPVRGDWRMEQWRGQGKPL